MEIEEKKRTRKKEEYEPVKIEKSNSNFIILVVISVVLTLVLIGMILFMVLSNGSSSSDNSSSGEKVEIKYTESSTVKSDGVYITDVSDVVDEVMPSIVAITSKTIVNSGRFGPNYYGGQYVTEGAGSGVIVAENDNDIYILTNYHVVENSKELTVKFINDKSVDATIKGVSERKDVAIVSVSKKDLDNDTLEAIKIATLGDSDSLKVGNGIIAIGNALGYGQSVTTGVVSALNREVKADDYTQEMIQIDAAINGGNSGGALLNSRGEVVGINTAKYSSSATSSSSSIEGMGFAIPISDVKDLLDSLIEGKNDSSGVVLGIEGYMTNSSGLQGYGLPTGFYISKLTDGGNAEKAGLEIGNIITEIDGKTVTSVDVIKNVLRKKDSGDSVKVKIKYTSKNEYKEKEISVSLK